MVIAGEDYRLQCIAGDTLQLDTISSAPEWPADHRSTASREIEFGERLPSSKKRMRVTKRMPIEGFKQMRVGLPQWENLVSIGNLGRWIAQGGSIGIGKGRMMVLNCELDQMFAMVPD